MEILLLGRELCDQAVFIWVVHLLKQTIRKMGMRDEAKYDNNNNININIVNESNINVY